MFNRFCSFGEQCVCVLSPVPAPKSTAEHYWRADVL